MDVFDIFEQLESTSGSNAKIAILKEHKDHKEFVELLDMALNFKHKFFIKKFDGTLARTQPVGNTTPKYHQEFLSILGDLKARNISGHEALNVVETFIAHLPSFKQKKWYTRVLLKDIRCGFGISSCVKAGINIPEFEVMLAKDGKECKNLETIVQRGVYVSPKLDGYRCLAVCSHGNVSLYSRSGTEYDNFVQVAGSLAELCKDSSFVLDGEIMSDDFNAMQQTAFSGKRGTVVGDVVYNVFGWIPMDEWESGDFKMPTKQRLDNLYQWFDNLENHCINPDCLALIEHELVYKVEDILRIEQEFLKKGHEGAMALPNIPYYLGKKTNKLMKFKTMLSQDCKVVSLYEGTGKYEGSMGGMSLTQENGMPCDVGSGFTDDDRAYMWANKEAWYNRTAEIKYQELSKDGVMRFPIFLRWRTDKDETP